MHFYISCIHQISLWWSSIPVCFGQMIIFLWKLDRSSKNFLVPTFTKASVKCLVYIDRETKTTQILNEAQGAANNNVISVLDALCVRWEVFFIIAKTRAFYLCFPKVKNWRLRAGGVPVHCSNVAVATLEQCIGTPPADADSWFYPGSPCRKWENSGIYSSLYSCFTIVHSYRTGSPAPPAREHRFWCLPNPIFTNNA